MKLTAEQRRAAIADAARASLVHGPITLRASGDAAALTPARRDELLAKLRAGEYVELDLELDAYEQAPGVQNRKFVRLRDGAMMRAGSTGAGTPFLRDHDTGNVLSRGGTVYESKTAKLDDGHYKVTQRVKLTAPWAVELALLGLLDKLSVHWNPIGPVTCSLCGTEVFEECFHWRGDVVTADDGTASTIEWVFDDAELVETSAVSVPAVRSAHIESIRSALALSADNPGNRGASPQRKIMDPKLLALLGLALTAGVTEATAAVETLQRERDDARAKLAIVEAKNVILANDGKTSTEDKFISDAVLSGRITKGDEPQWRKLHSLSAPEATAMMAARAEGCATPVGAPRQSANDPSPAAAPIATGLDAQVNAALAAKGVDAAKAREFAGVFGAPDPNKALADANGIKQKVN